MNKCIICGKELARKRINHEDAFIDDWYWKCLNCESEWSKDAHIDSEKWIINEFNKLKLENITLKERLITIEKLLGIEK